MPSSEQQRPAWGRERTGSFRPLTPDQQPLEIRGRVPGRGVTGDDQAARERAIASAVVSERLGGHRRISGRVGLCEPT